MRSNQAAVQRRVNGARSNGVPPPTPSQNGYAPYPPTPSGYNNSMPSNTPPPPQEMPSKLTAQQQLQFILNALGDRIAKLEIGHQTITQTLGVSIPLNTTVSAPQNAKNYDQEIGQIQQNMNHLNLSIERLSKNVEQINEQQQQILQQKTVSSSPQPTTTSQIPNDEIIQNQEQILSNIDTLSSELDTRTEILTTEINKTKDLVLQLQSTVIHVFQTQFTKTSQQDLENENTNAPEEDQDQDQEDLPSLEYNHTDSNYPNLDSKAFFEYNVLPEALDEHTNNDYDENGDEEDDGDDNK